MSYLGLYLSNIHQGAKYNWLEKLMGIPGSVSLYTNRIFVFCLRVAFTWDGPNDLNRDS